MIQTPYSSQPDYVLTRIQSYLETTPVRVAYRQPALAYWIVEELRKLQAAAFVDRGDVILVSEIYKDALAAVEAELPPRSEERRLIGRCNGVWYAEAPSGDVWSWTGDGWRFVCIAAEWPSNPETQALAEAIKELERNHE